MWRAVFLVMVVGCAHTEHCRTDAQPTIRVESVGRRSSGYRGLYVSVSNTTDKELCGIVTCWRPGMRYTDMASNEFCTKPGSDALVRVIVSETPVYDNNSAHYKCRFSAKTRTIGGYGL